MGGNVSCGVQDAESLARHFVYQPPFFRASEAPGNRSVAHGVVERKGMTISHSRPS